MSRSHRRASRWPSPSYLIAMPKIGIGEVGMHREPTAGDLDGEQGSRVGQPAAT